MRLTQPQKVEAIISRPEDYLVWIQKIRLHSEVKNLLFKIRAKIVIEITGVSTQLEARVVHESGKVLGNLDWFLEIFSAKKILKKAISANEALETEEAMLDDIAKIIETCGDDFKIRTDRLNAVMKKISLHVDRIDTIKANIREYRKISMEEQPDEIQVAVLHILAQASKMVGLLVLATKYLAKKQRIDIEGFLFEEGIPLWIYQHFTKELPRNEEGELLPHDNPASYFYPLNFTLGVYFTSREISNEEFLEANQPLAEGNEAFIRAVQVLLENVERADEPSLEEYMEQQISKMKWNLSAPRMGSMEVICARANGKGLRMNNRIETFDLVGEEKYVETSLNLMRDFNHHWNSVTRFQTTECHPVENFWGSIFETSEWNRAYEKNIYAHVANEKDFSILAKIESGDPDTIRDYVIPYIKIIFKKEMLKYPDTMERVMKTLGEPESKVWGPYKVPEIRNYNYREPTPRAYELARKIVRSKMRNITTRKEQEIVKWENFPMSELKESREFIERLKIGIPIENWIKKFLVGNEEMDEIAVTTIKTVLEVAEAGTEDRERMMAGMAFGWNNPYFAEKVEALNQED